MNNKNKHIVLIHGLYMPSLIMQYLDSNFKKRGFTTHKFAYNSLRFLRPLNASIALLMHALMNTMKSTSLVTHWVVCSFVTTLSFTNPTLQTPALLPLARRTMARLSLKHCRIMVLALYLGRAK